MFSPVMRTGAALLSLCFWLNVVIYANQTGSKCVVRRLQSSMISSLRIVGGAEASYGSHPWLVSLRNKGSHFCGGAILSQRWIMTAAHCFTSTSPSFLSGVSVVAGEFDLRVVDEDEQVFGVQRVLVHEKYRHALPVSYDIALVELDRPIKLGANVKPICLPSPGEKIPPLTSCIVGGWGRIKERGRLPSVLREVQLDLVDSSRCQRVLRTVTGSLGNDRPVRFRSDATVLCAGPERGGRDACQGDSGGPLVCRRGSGGHALALGVTSWGKGCGRSWLDNAGRPPSRRGSPGFFTDVTMFVTWIKKKLRRADHRHQVGTNSSSLCSVTDGLISVNESDDVIRNPAHSGSYSNNEWCVWRLSAPPGLTLQLQFDRLDLGDESNCRHDRVAVTTATDRPVGFFCARRLRTPVILTRSQNATLLFSSDISGAGSGFVVRHRALRGRPDPGCGSVVLVEDETVVQTPNYPESYSNDCVVRWVVYAPQGHVVKLDFVDLDLEESVRCLYDSVTVTGDVEQTEEIALLCGSSVPPPVLSYASVMVIEFASDVIDTHRGFNATLTFISQEDLNHDEDELHQDHVTGSRRHVQQPDFVNLDADDPDVQESSSRVLHDRGEVDQKSPEDPRPRPDLQSPDDEDYSGESSGTL